MYPDKKQLELLIKLQPVIKAKMESYNYKGYCTSRLPDYKKCRLFEEHEVGRGICKFLLFGGACDCKPDTMDEVVDIFDCRREIK